ncbi:PAR14-like protein, partial [Mya arenaria]
ADVIVNSTSVDLNLDRGHVSSQINKRAGTKLQKAVYRNAKKINFWEYIKMRATVRLLLNEANRMSCNSIALPALGTGYLGYKPRDAATAIFLAVSDFVQFHGDRSHLEDITIVIYQTEENIFQAFKKVEAEMKPVMLLQSWLP